VEKVLYVLVILDMKAMANIAKKNQKFVNALEKKIIEDKEVQNVQVNGIVKNIVTLWQVCVVTVNVLTDYVVENGVSWLVKDLVNETTEVVTKMLNVQPIRMESYVAVKRDSKEMAKHVRKNQKFVNVTVKLIEKVREAVIVQVYGIVKNGVIPIKMHVAMVKLPDKFTELNGVMLLVLNQ